jgi:hypothetical protein
MRLRTGLALLLLATLGLGIGLPLAQIRFEKPSASTINLATSVTGILPLANGGTGTATAPTLGSVLFAGPSGIFAQDNTNLFWDDTTNRLGIGTATPGAPLHILGSSGTILLVQASGAAGEMALRSTQAPVDANVAGRLQFQALDSGSTNTAFGEIRVVANTVLDGGTEAGSMHFYTRAANSNAMRWTINPSGHWLTGTDNLYDIGASGATRPRTLYLGTSLILPNGTVSAPSLVFGGSAAFYASSAAITVTESSTNRFSFAPQAAAPGLVAANDMAYGWSSTTSSAASLDTGLRRNAAGVVEINNGTAAAYRDLKARAWESTGYAFASLPAANNGATLYCSDCTFANPCAGSGTGAFAKRLNGAWRCD